MDGILEFLNSDLGKIIILAVTAIFFGKNPLIIDLIFEFLKIQKPKTAEQKIANVLTEKDKAALAISSPETRLPDSVPNAAPNGAVVNKIKVDPKVEIDDDIDVITRSEAFDAVDTLIEYFSVDEEDGKEGLEATKEVGKCLFI